MGLGSRRSQKRLNTFNETFNDFFNNGVGGVCVACRHW